MSEVFRRDKGDRPSVPNLAIFVMATQADRRTAELEVMSSAIRAAQIRATFVSVTEVQEPNPDAPGIARSLGISGLLVENFIDLGSVVDQVLEEACQDIGERIIKIKI